VVKTEDQELKTDIVRTTNKQTPVATAGFKALDKIQLDIEEYFGRNDFFYDRRKSYYKNNGKPINKIISIQLLAQSVFSIIYLEPSIARSKPNSLIKEDKNYDKVFNNIKKIGLYLLCINLFKIVDKQLRIYKTNANDSIKKTNNNQKEKNEIKKIIAGNFKFHICRIVASKITNNTKPNLQLFISKLNELEELIKKQEFEEIILDSFNTLVDIVSTHLSNNNKNIYDLISISKQSSFDKEINIYLEEMAK